MLWLIENLDDLNGSQVNDSFPDLRTMDMRYLRMMISIYF